MVVASLPMRAPAKPLFARELPSRSAARHAASDHRRPCAAAAGPDAQPRARAVRARRRTQDRRAPRARGDRAAALGWRGRALRPRLRITGIRGYDKELGRVQEALVDELGFKPADQPLIDEAVRAAGGVPGGLPTKVGLPLTPDRRSDAAAAVVLRGMLEVIEANLDGTIADLDSEFLHDFRVSVRRSRSVQRELKTVFPPGDLAHTGPSSAGSSRSPAMSATSTSTCSSSTRCARSCPRRCGAISSRCCACCGRGGSTRAGRWCERCAPSGPRCCCRRGVRSSTASSR